MDKAKACFLQLISDYLHNKKSDIPPDCDMRRMCLYSEQHQISPIIYYQTKCQSLVSSYSMAISAYANRIRLSNLIMEQMRHDGINVFQTKGQLIAEYYPNPQFRMMGDIDLVVNDIESAHKVMIDNGFECISRIRGREWNYRKNSIEFEIHDRLVYEEAINDERIDDFLYKFWPYVKNNVLDANFHLIFIIAHLRKHFMNSGVGFRQFLDVAIMEKNCLELDWNWIEGKLEEIGLLSFTQTVIAIIDRWWGIEPPIKAASITDEFFASATEHIFENGVFGFNNPDNDNYLAANEARIGSRTAGALRVLFPSYKGLCACDAYAFLRGKPILLPIAWIYRIFRCIKSGNSKANFKKLTGKFVSSDYVEQREEMFRRWGLVK